MVGRGGDKKVLHRGPMKVLKAVERGNREERSVKICSGSPNATFHLQRCRC